ncbi:hypothetical protein [Schaalia sp. ZJ1691]|uniref:hypothetical protein n=1 Tax=Schaalia sp. ZJ1691 TaxID=2709404 RepID=UPI0013EA2651|nr:hypothetical protein [Schaalia sp. ZJ1691]
MKLDIPVFFAALNLIFALILFVIASTVAGWPANCLPGAWLLLSATNYALWMWDRQ